MQRFAGKLFEEMKKQLLEVSQAEPMGLRRFDQSYRVISACIARLKEQAITYTFADTAEEVHFFKMVKPSFVQELVYYGELMRMEAERPAGCSKESLIRFYEDKGTELRHYLKQQQSLRLYYQTGQTCDDIRFFTRQSDSYAIPPDGFPDMDTRFTTVASSHLSRILGYELTLESIEGCIVKTASQVMGSAGSDAFKGQWTDTQSALIELAYALHARGCVDHGKGDVKEIVTMLEFIFQTDAGNFYRTFQSMRLRKKTRTVFLSALSESLVKLMDDTDAGF